MPVARRAAFVALIGTAVVWPLAVLITVAMATMPAVSSMTKQVHGDEGNCDQDHEPVC